MFHHGTIRKYTAAMLNLFNDLEIQYEDSNGSTRARNIPIKYSSIEKYKELDNYSAEQLTSGNVNVLPRAALALSTMIKAEQRIQNKNLKINKVKQENSFEYMYNSVPYEFTFELAIICRGMNEAAMIIEQIAPRFNPVVNIDVWDAENLNEPTRIPVKLLDIGIESNEYDELSSNLVTVNVGLSIMGNLYPPVKTVERIKEFKMYMGHQIDDKYKRVSIFNYDVDSNGKLVDGTFVHLDRPNTYAPNIIDIVANNLIIGVNKLTLIYDDKDNKPEELTFAWAVLSGSCILRPTGYGASADLEVQSEGSIEIQCTITDVYGNYSTLTKIFNIRNYVDTLPTDLNTNIGTYDLNMDHPNIDLNEPRSTLTINNDLNLGNANIDLRSGDNKLDLNN